MSASDTLSKILHPPEPVAKTSVAVAIAGLCLVTGVMILALFNWASRGERNGKPDVFGKHVTVAEVAEKYKALWTPGKFWPRNAAEHTTKNHGAKGYPIYKWVWMFLTAWLGCSGLYLVFAGLVREIEVFREEAHLAAAACVSAALCLCAAWPIAFRVGSTNESDTTNTQSLTKSGARSDNESHSSTKLTFLWLSFGLLFFASGFAVAGSSVLRAWTLPGPQYGTLFFLAPGYGLFAGWLIFATALNCSVAIAYSSYPDGTLAWPNTFWNYTHRDSLWPPFVAIVLLTISVLIMDPAIPLPMLISLFFFTPRHISHMIACGICAIGIAASTWLVLVERELW